MAENPTPTYRCAVTHPVLHVTNGDAVVPELAAAAGVEPAEVLAWRDVLHEGPVPAGLGTKALAEVRARHLAAREPIEPDPAAFAALRSDDPRAWLAIPAFARLFEELPDSRTGLSRLERQILEALRPGPLSPGDLFTAATATEHPPWVGDAPLLALADDLASLAGGVHLGPGGPGWAHSATSRRPIPLD